MPVRNVSGSQSLYTTLKAIREALEDEVYRPLAERINGILARYADADGNIALRDLDAILEEVDALIKSYFVGSNERAFGRDGVTPQSIYAGIINRFLLLGSFGAIIGHTRQIQRSAPADVFNWLQRVPDTFAQQRAPAPGMSNPLAQYDAPHTWIDPKGYRLSDRIWNASIETRRRMNQFLADSIRQGKSSLSISKELEQFLLPSRANLRTRKPYGTDASLDGMRLARTEITRAHSQASYAAAQANPFVNGMDWALSHRHVLDDGDPCERNATIWRDGRRVKEPYPMTGKVPLPVADSHPQCICVIKAAVSGTPADIARQLALYKEENATPPYPTPANPRGFLAALLGGALVGGAISALAGNL